MTRSQGDRGDAAGDDLAPMLRPRSVAVIGASESPGPGRHLVANLLRAGFAGEIYPVNPRYSSVQGLPCYPTIARLPGPVDCAAIAAPVQAVSQLLRECAEAGAGAAIVIASGFAEAGGEGESRQAEIRQVAMQAGIPLCGPNCLGVFNPVDKVFLTSAPPETVYLDLPPGSLGIVSQSGGLLISTMELGYHRGLGFRYLISSGNEAVLHTSDFIKYMVSDPAVKVIATIVEGFSDGEAFLEAALLALKAEKPIIALKLGRSEEGKRGTQAHTATLAGSQEVCEAAFRQLAVTSVMSIDELVETAALFCKAPPPATNSVAAVTISGGTSVLLSDLGADMGIRFPPPTDATKARLSEALPGFATVTNPLDATGPALYADVAGLCLEAFLEAQEYGLVCFGLPMKKEGGSPSLRGLVARAQELAGRYQKPLVVISTISEGLTGYWRETCIKSSLPLLQDLQRGLGAVKALIDYGERRQHPWDWGSRRGLAPLALSARSDGPFLSYRDTVRLLESAQIQVAPWGLATDPESAGQVAPDYPAVLKVLSPDIPHKTESGLIALDVGRDEIRDRCAELLARARQLHPEAHIEGVLVQPMVRGGVEVIVGLNRDPSFGPVLLLGMGGIFAETLRDTTLRLCPISVAEARQMIGEVRGAQLLLGARGRPRADLEALADLLVRTSELGARLPSEITSLDMNPVMVLPEGQGAVVVDVLAQVQSP